MFPSERGSPQTPMRMAQTVTKGKEQVEVLSETREVPEAPSTVSSGIVFPSGHKLEFPLGLQVYLEFRQLLFKVVYKDILNQKGQN